MEGLLKRYIALKNETTLWFHLICRRLGMSRYEIQHVVLPEQDLIYIPIAKNACTSILYALYEIEYNRVYDNAKLKQFGYKYVHDFYKKRSEAYTSVEKLKATDKLVFTVIRDPVKRFISCYRNRVVDLKDLEETKDLLEQKGLPLEPDINTFALRLQEYRNVNKVIEHHSRPQSHSLGNTLSYVDKIFFLDNFEEIKEFLKRFKPGLKLRQAKTGGSFFSLSDLSPEALEKIITFYSEDYRLLSEFYSPEKIRTEYENSLG